MVSQGTVTYHTRYSKVLSVSCSLKPTTVLAFVERSDQHIEEFGENIEVIWKPDASAIVVHVS